jgi:hypothetical protein
MTRTLHAFAGARAPYVRLLRPARLVQGRALTAFLDGPSWQPRPDRKKIIYTIDFNFVCIYISIQTDSQHEFC